MKYRTKEQYREIMESIENGNWTQGAEECVKYGFYAHDLINAFNGNIWDTDEQHNEELENLVYLVEMATELRNK